MNIPEVRTASQDEHDAVIHTVLVGFASDPLVRWFWPDATRYLASGPGFDAFGGAAVASGTAFVTGQLEGAALWMPPGVTGDDEAMAAYMMQTAPPEIMEDMLAVFEAMEASHPEEDVWYLPLIGVDPAHQGKGFGAALMKAALEKVDEAGLPAYLESSNPRNISLYERHGFEVVTEIQVGSSPVVTPMYRQAR